MMIKVLFIIIPIVTAQEQNETQRRHTDYLLNVKQLIIKYGFPFENHAVLTEDGYLLEIQRIPYGRNSVKIGDRPPVLLVPGLFCSSVDFVNTGLNNSLGLLLADQGYDVWLANYRGTTWSRKHISLDPDNPKDKKEFWNYSFHEIGLYDLPAFIDYILNTTRQEGLYYIGHSQGTTSFLVLTSQKPEYNRKVKLFVSLAAVAYISHSTSPVLRFLATYSKEIEDFTNRYQFYELIPHSIILGLLGHIFCNDFSPFQDVCASVFYIAAGYSDNQFNKTHIPAIATNTPAGASIKQLQHYVQLYLSKSFQPYDYGEKTNLKTYGQLTPPSYDLTKVTVPVAIYYGSSDAFSNRKDINRMSLQLRNVIVKKRLKGFNHLDVLWGMDVVDMVFNEVFELMKRF